MRLFVHVAQTSVLTVLAALVCFYGACCKNPVLMAAPVPLWCCAVRVRACVCVCVRVRVTRCVPTATSGGRARACCGTCCW